MWARQRIEKHAVYTLRPMRMRPAAQALPVESRKFVLTAQLSDEDIVEVGAARIKRR
jgi:hypothetical protein